MIEILVKNSLCRIKNHSDAIHEELIEKLRYMDQSIEFSYRGTLKKIKRLNEVMGNPKLRISPEERTSLNKQLRHALHVLKGQEDVLWRPLFDDEGYFPTGLLPTVKEILKQRQVKYSITDQREKPAQEFNFNLREGLPPLRYYQKDAAKRLLEQHRGIVVMPTGTGKTKTACRMIWDLGVKTLVITPGKSITDHMMNDLVKYFGKSKVQKLNTKSVKTKPINVVNIQALINLPPKLFEDIKMVIIDEFHHAAADTYLEANEEHLKNCYYRIGLTATNFRNDGADLALQSVLSNMLYEYTIPQAISDGYIMQPEFETYDVELDQERTYQKAYKNQIVNNDERNGIIREATFLHEDRSVLILVKQVEHGEILNEMISGTTFIHGQTKDADRERIMEDFRMGRIKRLIGTSVIGEGVDLPIASVLVMAGGGKAKSQIMQNVGRVLRLHPGKPKPLVVDFTDEDGSWLQDHSEIRHDIYGIYSGQSGS